MESKMYVAQCPKAHLRLIFFPVKNTTSLNAVLFVLNTNEKKETIGCAEQNNLVENEHQRVGYVPCDKYIYFPSGYFKELQKQNSQCWSFLLKTEQVCQTKVAFVFYLLQKSSLMAKQNIIFVCSCIEIVRLNFSKTKAST